MKNFTIFVLFFISGTLFSGTYPYCLYDALNTRQMCALTSSAQICLPDNSDDFSPIRCIHISNNSVQLLSFSGDNYCPASTNSSCSTSLVSTSGAIAQSGQLLSVGNGICGFQNNYDSGAIEACDPGTTGAGLNSDGTTAVFAQTNGILTYCSGIGNIQPGAICINKTSCNKADVASKTPDSQCQFLDPCIRPSNGTKNSSCTGTNQYCYMGECRTAGTPGNACLADKTCNSGSCQTSGTDALPAPFTCSACIRDYDCGSTPATPRCFVSAGTCVECNLDSQCNNGISNTCSHHKCVCGTSNNACSAGQSCTSSGTCYTPPTTPSNHSICSINSTPNCGNNGDIYCVAGTCGPTCTNTNACSSSSVTNGTCSSGACVASSGGTGVGTTCDTTVASTCATGLFCLSTSGGTCQSACSPDYVLCSDKSGHFGGTICLSGSCTTM